LIGGLAFLNILLQSQTYTKLLESCFGYDEDTCLGYSGMFKQVEFYILVIIPGLWLLYSLYKRKDIIKMINLIPYDLYLFRNRYTYMAIFFGTVLKLFVSSLCLLILWMVINTGFNQNVDAGSQFFVPQVRATLYEWFNVCGIILACFLFYFLIVLTKSLEKGVVFSIFAQWYFSRTRLWLERVLRKAISALKPNFYSFVYYTALNKSLFPLYWILRKMKVYIDSIDIARPRHVRFIRFVKPFVYFYDIYLKYKAPSSLLNLVLFGENMNLSGYRIYYLKFRNWNRFKYFEDCYGLISNVGFLLNMYSTYAVFAGWTFLKQSSLIEQMAYTEINYLMYYPIVFGVIFGFIFNLGFRLIDYGAECLIFCYVSDEEMFQGSQHYFDEDLKSFINQISKEGDGLNLKKIVAQTGIASENKGKIANFFSKVFKRGKLDDFSNYQEEQKSKDLNNDDGNFSARNWDSNIDSVNSSAIKLNVNQDDKKEPEGLKDINLQDYIKYKKEKASEEKNASLRSQTANLSSFSPDKIVHESKEKGASQFDRKIYKYKGDKLVDADKDDDNSGSFSDDD
jgi:hypothetical protein